MDIEEVRQDQVEPMSWSCSVTCTVNCILQCAIPCSVTGGLGSVAAGALFSVISSEVASC